MITGTESKQMVSLLGAPVAVKVRAIDGQVWYLSLSRWSQDFRQKAGYTLGRSPNCSRGNTETTSLHTQIYTYSLFKPISVIAS